MPRLVMPDKIITAIIRYDFKSMFRFDQCLYKNDAVTSLPASKEAPINPISIGLAENIDMRPTTEKYAADTDIDKAVKNIIKANIIFLALDVFYVLCIVFAHYNNLQFLIPYDPFVLLLLNSCKIPYWNICVIFL